MTPPTPEEIGSVRETLLYTQHSAPVMSVRFDLVEDTLIMWRSAQCQRLVIYFLSLIQHRHGLEMWPFVQGSMLFVWYYHC